jgi:hypothetical protein
MPFATETEHRNRTREALSNRLLISLGTMVLQAIRMVEPSYGNDSWRNIALANLIDYLNKKDKRGAHREEINKQIAENIWQTIMEGAVRKETEDR